MSSRPPLTPVKHRASGSSAGLPFGFSTPLKQPSTPNGHSPAYLTSRRHSVYGTETKIVIDPGSKVIRVGFSGESGPRECIVPKEPLWDLNGIRDDLGVLDMLRNAYFEQLQTDPKQRKVLIVENPFLSAPVKYAIMSVLFSSLHVPSISFTPSSLLSLIAAGRTTGLVVDVGYLQTVVSPIYASRPLDPLTTTTNMGGQYLTEHLRTLVVEHGVYYPPFTAQQLSSATQQPSATKIPHEAITDAWLEDVKCRALFAEPHLRRSARDADGNGGDDTPVENTDDDVHTSQLSVKLQTSHGRGVVFIPGWVRQRAVEVMFDSRGDVDEPSIPECVVKCMQKLPIDIRRELAANCLVVGGTASMVGFRTRLKNEIRELLAQTTRNKVQLKDLSNLTGSFEVINDPIPTQAEIETEAEAANRRRSNKGHSKAPAWSPGCYAWVGGSLAGSVKLSAAEVHRSDFEESIEDSEMK